MSKRVALKDSVMVDAVDLSNFARSVEFSSEHERVDVSGFNATGSNEYLTGPTEQSVTVEFFGSYGTGEVHQTLYPIHRDREVVAFAWDFHRWRCGDGEITSVDATYAQLRRLGFSRPRKNIINAAMSLPDRNPARIIDPGPPEVPEPALTAAEIIGNIVSDATSRTAYGVHSWSAENLLTWGHKTSGTDDLEETKLFADYYLENYKQPVTRITQLGFRSIRPDDFRGPATWDLLTGVDISDAILVFVNYPGGDGFENEEFFIEGITYDVQPLLGENADPHYADVTLSLDVSPSAFYTIAPDGW